MFVPLIASQFSAMYFFLSVLYVIIKHIKDIGFPCLVMALPHVLESIAKMGQKEVYRKIWGPVLTSSYVKGQNK